MAAATLSNCRRFLLEVDAYPRDSSHALGLWLACFATVVCPRGLKQPFGTGSQLIPQSRMWSMSQKLILRRVAASQTNLHGLIMPDISDIAYVFLKVHAFYKGRVRKSCAKILNNPNNSHHLRNQLDMQNVILKIKKSGSPSRR
jgi:hypothetical protein